MEVESVRYRSGPDRPWRPAPPRILAIALQHVETRESDLIADEDDAAAEAKAEARAAWYD